MPSRVWSHLCDYATVDSSGKPSIIGEFDHIFAQNLPSQHPLFFVISKWNGNNHEMFSHEVKLTSPSGREIARSARSHIIIAGTDNGDGNQITLDSFMMILIDEFGEYAIEIMIDENPVHIL